MLIVRTRPVLFLLLIWSLSRSTGNARTTGRNAHRHIHTAGERERWKQHCKSASCSTNTSKHCVGGSLTSPNRPLKRNVLTKHAEWESSSLWCIQWIKSWIKPLDQLREEGNEWRTSFLNSNLMLLLLLIIIILIYITLYKITCQTQRKKERRPLAVIFKGVVHLKMTVLWSFMVPVVLFIAWQTLG